MPQSLIILRSHHWRFNPLQCFLTDVGMFMVVIVDMLGRVLGLTPRAWSLLSETVYRVFDRFGIWRGQRDHWPNPYDLTEEVRKSATANAAAKDALLNRLITLLLTLTPDRVAYRRGWNPGELARYSIDFELGGATETEKQLLLNWLPRTVFHQNVERGLANADLSLLFAVDDAQRLICAEGQHDSAHVGPLTELASVERSQGMGLWLNLQTFQGVPAASVANLRGKYCGPLGIGGDYSAIASHMSLHAEQVTYLNHFAKPGWFVGQTLGHPFYFNVPEVPDLPPVSDAEADASCEPLMRLPVERAHEFDHWQPFPSVEITNASAPQQTGAMLDEAELRYLRLVAERPGQA